MICIYTNSISARLSYIAEFIFNHVLGTEFKLVTHLSECHESDLILNYSRHDIRSHLVIKPVNLLFEQDIHEVSIEIKAWQGMPIFFLNDETEIPFDLFAATFYLIARYEEYLPYHPDEFKRFPHTQSIAFKNGFLNTPLVDKWIAALKSILLNINSELKFQSKPFSFIPTYDIDIAYSYRGKGLIRNAGGIMKDLVNGNFSKVKERAMVLLHNRKDPFDAYDFLDELHAKYHLEPIYFILFGDGKGLDKNLSPHGIEMQELVKRLSSNYTIGIHPSYKSNESNETLLNEVTLFKAPTHSRQHYIRFSLPETYRRLIEVGIINEYSMGYGSINGFRASTSHSYLWFDLQKNQKELLRIHPFCYMECNARFEQKQTPSESLSEMLHLYHEVKKVNGRFISIWHNFSLGAESEWKPWKDIYIQFIQQTQTP